MSNEYPKALYSGNTKSYVHVIADDEDHEQRFRDEGYVNYSELKDPEIKIIRKASGSSEELEKAQKELLEALKANQELEEQLATAQGEYIAKINELQKENSILKFNAMDATELKEILDSKEVKYGSRDGKDTLVSLVINTIYPEEGE